MNSEAIRLLPPSALVRTGPVDHAAWSHQPLLRNITGIRHRLALRLLPARPVGTLLEIGYGSGIFMPELARHCRALYGIDHHLHAGAVRRTLAAHGVDAALYAARAEALPFASSRFDCLVAISALEFVEDLDAACREFRRVLAPAGRMIVVTPGCSPLVDFGLKLLTGEDPRRDFADRRERIMPTLRAHFAIARELTSPRLGNDLLRLYRALLLR